MRHSKKQTAVSVLGTISGLLTRSRKGDDALKEIGDWLNAGAAVLYRKLYRDEDTFSLDRLGFWEQEATPESTFLFRLEAGQVPGNEWDRLAAGKTARLPGTGILLSPLFLDERLFGFLGLSGGENLCSAPGRKLIRSASRIFEMWIARLNVEKRLRDLIDYMPSPTFVMNAREVITEWNPATVEMTGWAAERIIGKEKYESAVPYYGKRRPMVSNLILHPDPKWEAMYHEFRKEGDVVYSLAFCNALPGGGGFLRTKTQRLYDLNHRLAGSIHTVRDVTLERKMEKSLHRSESMYRAISDFAGLGIMLLRDREILYCNERMVRFLGLSGPEITIGQLTEWIHPDDRKEIEGNYRELFKGAVPHTRFEFRARNGTALRHYRAYCRLLEYEEQPAVYFIVDDITEQRELAEKARLNELRLYHEDRLTALGTMAAGIAHELNQPLNTIRVVADGLLFGREEGWDLEEEEFVDNLGMISRQVVRMTEVIRNIRDFSREEREVPVWDINANEAIRNVFSMIGRQLEAHGITVRKDLGARLSPIKGNLNRLEQVIMNLIVNARQALDQSSGQEKNLWVRTSEENGSVRIEVRDNALGIPENLLVKIFDPFFTTKEVGKGTGLGLSISQSIISELRGRIEARNNPSGGATFLVVVPASGG